MAETLSLQSLTTLFLDLQQEALRELSEVTSVATLEKCYIGYFGAKGEFTTLIKHIREIERKDRKTIGEVANTIKHTILDSFEARKRDLTHTIVAKDWRDVTSPGIKPREGHLHVVSHAISEIEEIFKRIGFYRVRYPEIDTDWYAFESLNMPPHHPARDEWETFFVKTQNSELRTQNSSKIVLTPHTSNGQVREMELRKPPIRMINVGKCYRRQSDISHVPMFHQFEGLYIDRNVSIVHLKGVLDYFVTHFFGPTRKARIRPFHFQFTEPSFEVDISCDVCQGRGKLQNGSVCRLCKSGWLELGGAGMVHPTVLKNGGIDPVTYSGFAFGWGIERTYMMKEGIKIDDIRLLYSNDVRFLEQF